MLDSLVFASIHLSTCLQAAWNALVEENVDRFTMMLMIAAVPTGIACAIVPFVPLPAPAAWPWLFLTAIPHTTYRIFPARAYDTGELARIYPIMRGLTLARLDGGEWAGAILAGLALIRIA